MNEGYVKINIIYSGSKSAIKFSTADSKLLSSISVNLRGVCGRGAKLIALTLAAPFCTKVYLDSEGDVGLLSLLSQIHSNHVNTLPMQRRLKAVYRRIKPHLANIEIKTDDKKAYFCKGKVCFYE